MDKKRNQGTKKQAVKNQQPADFGLWTEVAKSVTPLPAAQKNKSKLTQNPPDKTKPAAARTAKKDAPDAPLTPGRRPAHAAPARPHSQQPVNLDKKQIRRVKRGKKIEARIDLHGDFAEVARQRLRAFFVQSQAENKRWVLVITGKGVRGEGVLRREVPLWLRSSDFAAFIVGFEEAGAGLGGSGALIVQLRKKA